MSDQDWWRGAVFYQIYPRSFKDSDDNGIGDLKGITEKLDYVASLGVDALWLSPFFKSPMDDFGYDVSDYCDVDPLFGTLKDFDQLLEKAHGLGLKIIIDLVLNHTSIKHPWFVESRQNNTNAKKDWYVWADPKPDGTPPNNWLSVFGGSAWTFDLRRGQYYYHQFLKQQPDLNIRNPEVQEALMNAATFWLDRGVDGFRLDAVNHCIHDAQLRDNPPKEADPTLAAGRFKHPYYMQWHRHDKSQKETLDFLRRLRKLTDRYEGRMMVAEIGDDFQVDRCIEYTAGPDLLHTSYGFSLLNEKCSAAHIRATLTEYSDKAGLSWPSWSFSNHDVIRVATRWAKGKKYSTDQVKKLLALVTTLWGTPFLYQGEELGLTEADIPFEKLQDPYGIFLWPEDKGRDGCRTPMPWTTSTNGFSKAESWLPIPDDHLKLSVENQEKDTDSSLNFLRRFLKWRKQHRVFFNGNIKFLDADEPVLAFTRGDKILAVFNLGDQPARFKPKIKIAALTGHGLPSTLLADGTIELPAFGAFFGTV